MATEKSEYVLAVSRHMYFSSTRSMMKVQNRTDKENLMSTSCVLVAAASKKFFSCQPFSMENERTEKISPRITKQERLIRVL